MLQNSVCIIYSILFENSNWNSGNKIWCLYDLGVSSGKHYTDERVVFSKNCQKTCLYGVLHHIFIFLHAWELHE